MSKIGRCSLCKSQRELRESHFMPAAAYKLVQKSAGEAPVVIKSTATIQKHEQVKDALLCNDCERRFSENGERWVMEHCYRHNEGFKLKELIDGSKPITVGSGLKVYSAASIPQIDIGKLSYFAASIMWRGSAHEWRSGSVRVRTPKLGSRYEEALRRYLLGETGFPANAALWVSVIPTAELWNSFAVPYGGRLRGFWRYKFPFLGIAFVFFLGSRIDAQTRRMCTVRSQEMLIYMGNATSQFVTEDAGRLIQKSKPVGSMRSL